MRWRTCLIALSATLLLTSCAHSEVSEKRMLPVESSCRIQCEDAPKEVNPPRAYVQSLLDWGYRCVSLHDECVASLRTGESFWLERSVGK